MEKGESFGMKYAIALILIMIAFVMFWRELAEPYQPILEINYVIYYSA